MPINQNIYPYNEQVKKLPVYLTGIGGSEYQYHIIRPEGYNWSQILYSAHGKGCLKYNGSTVSLTEGYYFFLPKDFPHEYYPVSENWDVRWVAFDGTGEEALLESLKMTRPAVVCPDNGENMRSLFGRMMTALSADKVYGSYTCAGLVYSYIIEFHKLLSDRANPGGSNRSSILTPAINYIDEHFREDFSLSVLAEMAGVSPQHLCRIFKETMNMRPVEYLTYRRIREAEQLLCRTDLPVSEICETVGFSGAGYFSTVFRKCTGIAPSEFREKNTIND
ncbi:MAG: AraC family transcriptional regulator [Oscillospiraceae bacterium]|nr:AraC family transcriptional regulator [Oscillospiraceae bacterium]